MATRFPALSRRFLLAGLAASAAGPACATNSAAAGNAPDTLPTPATPNGRPWTRGALIAAMEASHRPASLGADDFTALEAARAKARLAVATYLTRQLGLADPLVTAAFAAVPREYFCYNYATRSPAFATAYAASDKAIPLGFNATLPDAPIQAVMTQLLSPRPGESALEIGTGSGYHAALLSRIAGHVDTIEIVPDLARPVASIFAPLGYSNITPHQADGYAGWPARNGGYDLILITCSVPYVPPALIAQLKPGGRMVVPLYRRAARRQSLYLYHKDATGTLHTRRELRCYFEPMTGTITTAPPPPDEPA